VLHKTAVSYSPLLFLQTACAQSELSAAASKATEEREFLRSLNETLLANQKDFGCKLKAAQAALADKDAQLQDLQEQVGQRRLSKDGGYICYLRWSSAH
jgi:hypothetical protein